MHRQRHHHGHAGCGRFGRRFPSSEELLSALEVHFPSAAEGAKGPYPARLLDKDPRRDLAILAVKAVKKAQRAQIGFLHQIFRIMLVVRQPTGQVVSGVQVRQEQLLVPCLPACICQAIFLASNPV